ncbi:tRNA 2-thiouridine(34) synthase MnmA [Candidatus Nomurabacteria bacterium RIFOXYC2_FULL_36_8]|nr:MAG: tRNA-specific 2-thiouridylase MnmA [Candidatus Nomurabacteria bacterium GW2011_GWE2_36_115]KKP94153.1 MAG: tRNA-specific 2-thiouridylase MnmA [Candidatus Nomurabacteria bacterium GW2011_GWF2_36_126]KKP96719.1 MAG: tRNA-specific 2-thiouridylase MnmA [Candidatus Nomurabacteria bacterium GW2011_GWD2_36_14]KKP99677.1 MAG: tRNA-specific 2-thiouridylase MnmA [Candidatus Nomurabacteria bacterium GW2011_GWF2_36_19]KKQ05378.1 MAG: tRNA-specific 2-thiouridylase MnmA [Candidatus Nomurabacteria bac
MGKKINKTVFVGVSGGVDSSVSAALLKEQGYNVVGVFIRTWTPEFIECTWKDERRDAMRVCAHLDIPFLECDAEEAYKKGVADYMIEEYKKGNTPNPDVMCNREVKFGVFWQFAKAHGADYIATGHYAINDTAPLTGAVHLLDSLDTKKSQKVLRKLQVFASSPPSVASQGLSVLRKSPDSSKDQSYFLWTLTQDDLAHTLFPVGHLQKTEVRKLAEKYKLPVATKKDSQGVCFLGPLDMKDFLKHYIKTKKGDVLLALREGGDKKGNIIGEHDGAIFFTLGERHGFTIFKNEDDSKPLYVVSKDIEKNTITVSPRSDLGEKKDKLHRTVLCSNANWILGMPEKDKTYKAQIRYHGELLDCKVGVTGLTCEITFDKNVLVDKGQSVVIYDGDICLGGAIVG